MVKKGANTSDSTAMSLIRMLSDGPEVSLSGSPMVPPITCETNKNANCNGKDWNDDRFVS